MDLAALQTRIAELYPGTDPLTPDQVSAAGVTLRADTVSQFPAEIFINSRTIYAIFGPEAGETILEALETAATGNPVIKRAIGWMDPANGGIDMRLASSQAMVDSLTGNGLIFTSDQAVTLKGWGAVQVPRWPDLRDPDDIIAARSLS